MEKKLSYRDLIVWQKAMLLAKAVYKLTNNFPDSERFGLISQMRRSAVSIPSNIAEGRYRSTKKDFCQFLTIAFASGAELETQLELSVILGIAKQEQIKDASDILTEVMKMLNVMIRNMRL